jgi:hypothetical protein
MKELLNLKSYIIGVLTAIIILMAAYMHFHGEEYRRVSNAAPLSCREKVGTLPNGKEVVRIIIPYRGRFHYIYVTDDTSTLVKKTYNGKTTNLESETHIK